MAEIMMKDLETDQELDHEALAKLIGGHYRGQHCGKNHFEYYCAHHWHHHHRGNGHHRYDHWTKYREKCWNFYEKHWKDW